MVAVPHGVPQLLEDLLMGDDRRLNDLGVSYD